MKITYEEINEGNEKTIKIKIPTIYLNLSVTDIETCILKAELKDIHIDCNEKMKAQDLVNETKQNNIITGHVTNRTFNKVFTSTGVTIRCRKCNKFFNKSNEGFGHKDKKVEKNKL